jgi:hypothetical protein
MPKFLLFYYYIKELLITVVENGSQIKRIEMIHVIST